MSSDLSLVRFLRPSGPVRLQPAAGGTMRVNLLSEFLSYNKLCFSFSPAEP